MGENPINNQQEIIVDQNVGGHSTKSRYFVSNGYVENIVDNMQSNTQNIQKEVDIKVEELTDRVQSALDIRNYELPEC